MSDPALRNLLPADPLPSDKPPSAAAPGAAGAAAPGPAFELPQTPSAAPAVGQREAALLACAYEFHGVRVRPVTAGILPLLYSTKNGLFLGRETEIDTETGQITGFASHENPYFDVLAMLYLRSERVETIINTVWRLSSRGYEFRKSAFISAVLAFAERLQPVPSLEEIKNLERLFINELQLVGMLEAQVIPEPEGKKKAASAGRKIKPGRPSSRGSNTASSGNSHRKKYTGRGLWWRFCNWFTLRI